MLVRGCLLLVAAATAAACASASAPRTPAPELTEQGQALVVLLPDPGTNAVGRAEVSNRHGSVSLSAARESTRVSANTAPSAPSVLSEREVRELFGAALEGMPPAPEHFTLFFKFESEELTDESQLVLKQVLQAVKARPVPDVVAVGHTDTTGRPRANAELGLRRATAVRAMLVGAGLTQKAIEVASHGEAELLITTGDGVFEPRNRRVEITVR
jgi:outer membrane protein OmpA-like peptidoglycan-associated protein